MSHFSLRYLLLAILLALVPWLTNTLRVSIWTRFLGKRYRIRDMFRVVLGTELGSAISPTAIGGGYIKMGMLIQKGLPPGQAASLMTLGSLEDAFFFVLALPPAILYTSAYDLPVFGELIDRLQPSTHALAGIGTALFVMFVLMYFGRKSRLLKTFVALSYISGIAGKFKKLWLDFITVYQLVGSRGKLYFCVSLLLTSIQWICRYSVISALLACFQVPVNPVLFFLFQWVVFTLMTFVPTPGAMVGAEAAFYFIYGAFLPRELVGIITAGWRFLTYYFQLSLGSVIFGIWNLKHISSLKR